MSRSSNVVTLPSNRSVMDYLSQVKVDARSGRFILLEKEKPLLGYATFTGLQLMIGKEPMFTECTVSFTNQRLLMTRKLSPSSNGEIVGWALDRQFIHAIKDCAGGLFKSSKCVRLVIKDPKLQQPTEEDYFELIKDPSLQQPTEEDYFELKFPEEDFSELKQSFLNVLKIVDLCKACDEDRFEDFQMLLQSNPTLVNIPIDSKKNTLLIMACARNKAAFARYLLQFRDIDINKTTTVQVMRDGKLGIEIYGALYYACINNMEEVVEKLLLIPTADLNILYTDENTALQYALRKDIECQSAFASNPNSRRISYAKIVSMLMSSRKTNWKIGENKIFAIPESWILNATGDTQKAILLCSRGNELPADLKQKLATKQRKIQSYKSLNGQVVRLDSLSTIATDDSSASPTISGVVTTDPIEIDPRRCVSIEKPQNKEDFDSIPALHLQPPVSKHYFNETGDNKVQIKSVCLPSKEDQTYLEFPSKISKSQSSQSISSKIGDVDPFTEEVNRWRLLLASLELSPTLQLSFIFLNILKYDDDISIAKSLKFHQITAFSAKQRKSWKQWKDEILTSIYKPLPEPLNGDDFESIKTLMFAEIEGIHTKYFEKAANEETFKAVHQLKAQVESLFLSSKEFVNEINQWKALLERLKLSPTLQLSFVILNILTLEDSILNFPETTYVLAKQRKLWMLWKGEILTSIHKPLPELNEEDFESIKKLMFAEIEGIYTRYVHDAVDAPLFEDLYKLESQVERLFLSSKKSDTEFTNIDPFSADINKNQVKNLVSSSKGHHNQLGVTAGATSSPVTQTPFPLPAKKTSHVFIAHPWAEDEEGRNNHLRVEKLNDVLKNRRIVTWFDGDQIRQDKSSLRTILAKALYSTCCVLICITRKYEEKINKGDKSDHCLFEFNVATHDYELSNAIMTAVMEPSMLDVETWEREILKAELGGIVYTDLSSDTNFEENCEVIAGNIINMLQL